MTLVLVSGWVEWLRLLSASGPFRGVRAPQTSTESSRLKKSWTVCCQSSIYTDKQPRLQTDLWPLTHTVCLNDSLNSLYILSCQPPTPSPPTPNSLNVASASSCCSLSTLGGHQEPEPQRTGGTQQEVNLSVRLSVCLLTVIHTYNIWCYVDKKQRSLVGQTAIQGNLLSFWVWFCKVCSWQLWLWWSSWFFLMFNDKLIDFQGMHQQQLTRRVSQWQHVS